MFKDAVKSIMYTALSQSEEISSDFCCFYGGGIRHNEYYAFLSKFYCSANSQPPSPPLETRIWKLVVRALNVHHILETWTHTGLPHL